MEYFEFIPIFIVLAGGIGFLVYINAQRSAKPVIKEPLKPISAGKPTKEDVKESLRNPGFSVFESFDYHGTKILNTDGIYTVIEKGQPRVYASLRVLPEEYRRMMTEIDSCKHEKTIGKYYLENLNGRFFVRFPDGRKKQYKSYAEIPEKIKKVMVG